MKNFLASLRRSKSRRRGRRSQRVGEFWTSRGFIDHGGARREPTSLNLEPLEDRSLLAVITGNELIFASAFGNGVADGVNFRDEDIMVYNTSTNTWSMHFDGSDVGLGGTDINAIFVQADNSILMSFQSATNVTGLGLVDDSDIVLFTPTSLGDTTAGTFSIFFDGSDVGLDTNGEDVDAIAFDSSGDLVISTLGAFNVPAAVGTLTGMDEDLITFDDTSFGTSTAGTFSLLFDGSDVGLDTSNDEDVSGAWIDPLNDEIHMTTRDAFSVSSSNALSGDGNDIFACDASSTGSPTTCTFSLFFDAGSTNYSATSLDAISVARVSSSIHGIKFEDTNGNGVDDGEPRIAGLTITLVGDIDGDGTVDTTSTVTDGNGEYWFTGLAPGTYTVSETPPAGMVATTATTVTVTIVLGEERVAEAGQAMLGAGQFETIDTRLAFGNAFGGAIHGYKFDDQNFNGVDEGEPRLAGVLITLVGDIDGDGTVDTTSTLTDGNGEYWFTGLFPGTYVVSETPPAGTAPSTSSTVTLTVISGAQVVGEAGQASPGPGQFETIDSRLAFGNVLLGAIHGYKFEDVNGDGDDESGSDPRLSGVTITLIGDIDGDGTVDTTSTVTDGNGEYWFTGLFPGRYDLFEMIPSGTMPTTSPSVAVTIAPGQVAVAESGQGTLDPGQFETVNTELAFGNAFLGSIHGYKFEDVDGDGFDSGEPRIQGVTIQLQGDVDGDGAQETFSATTDANGEYWFENLFPGTYTVLEFEPIESRPTTSATVTVTLISGQEVVAEAGQATLGPGQFETVDTSLAFGNAYFAAIHGYKFEDENANGIDEGEPRLSGVTITLTGDIDGDGSVDTSSTVTDSNGEYWFNGLFPGTYFVSETEPIGSLATTSVTVTVSLISGEEVVAEAGQSMGGVGRFETIDERLAFGNAFLGSIHGLKFEDVDANGVLSSTTDVPLPGVLITLFGDIDGDGASDTTSTVTDGNGEYWFEGLFPGTYVVVETPPANSVPTTSPTVTVTIVSGAELVARAGQATAMGPLGPGQFETIDTQLAFGNTFLGTIHGYKFDDQNFNGDDDAESREPGVLITLMGDIDGDNLSETTSTVTDANGEYWFTGLFPGDYLVVETPPTGTAPTTNPTVSLTLISGEVAVAEAGQASLDPGQFESAPNLDLAFGNVVLGSIHGYKFNDLDASGTGDGDPRLPDVTITLVGDIDGDGNNDITSITTDANGEYWFTGLFPGTYTVFETMPDGTMYTVPPTVEVTIAAGEELVAETGQADPLGPGQFESLDTRLAFGNAFLGSIHGYKFEDVNTNGSDDTEPRLAGVSIMLQGDIDGDGSPDTTSTVTDGNGEYWFTGLFPGQFVITEFPPAGSVATTNTIVTVTIISGEERVAEAGQAMLGPGQFETVDPNLAFGNVILGSIHGYKFEDVDANGIDDSEPRIQGVSIQLQGDVDGDGGADTLNASTDANGEYWFEDLFPGTYVITETSPFGTAATTTATVTVTITSGAEVVAEAGQATAMGPLDPGQFETIDSRLAFGNAYLGSIHGIKFDDVDADGAYTSIIDFRLPGVTITLSGDIDGDGAMDTTSTLTDGNGEYWFEDLFPGTYVVSETPPVASVPTTNPTVTVTIISGEERVSIAGQATAMGPLGPGQFETIDTRLSFGNTFLAAIHGYKFSDENGNGIDDAEPRLEDVLITLIGDIDGDGASDTTSTLTDAGGEYWFTGLFPGNYIVSETPPIGTSPTTPPTYTLTLISGEAAVAEAGQATVMGPLNPGQFETVDPNLAFGNVILGSIHGYKFHDVNANGTDDGEPRLSDVTITLIGDIDGDGTQDTISTVTDFNGEYWFEDLFPGTYVVAESAPFASTPTTSPTVTLTIASGEEWVAESGQAMLGPLQFETVDVRLAFGNTFLGAIHGYKFEDLNANGIDDGEPRIQGVTIQLQGDIDGDGSPDTTSTTTDANGEYWFTGLFPGTFLVLEFQPFGSMPTTPPTVTVTLVSGEEVVAEAGQSMYSQFPTPQFETIDTRLAFGNAFLGAIHGYKFEDTNSNGIDDAEPRLADVTVTLTGDVDGDGDEDVTSTVTDGNGEYWFTDLFPEPTSCRKHPRRQRPDDRSHGDGHADQRRGARGRGGPGFAESGSIRDRRRAAGLRQRAVGLDPRLQVRGPRRQRRRQQRHRPPRRRCHDHTERRYRRRRQPGHHQHGHRRQRRILVHRTGAGNLRRYRDTAAGHRAHHQPDGDGDHRLGRSPRGRIRPGHGGTGPVRVGRRAAGLRQHARFGHSRL